MDASEAKFALLQHELESIQQGIQAMDSALFKVKGWCITVAAASAGLASTQSRVFIAIGLAVTSTFWLVDAYFKSLQRVYIRRDWHLQRRLVGKDPLVVLDLPLDAGGVAVPELAKLFRTAGDSWTERTFEELRLAGRRLESRLSSLYTRRSACVCSWNCFLLRSSDRHPCRE